MLSMQDAGRANREVGSFALCGLGERLWLRLVKVVLSLHAVASLLFLVCLPFTIPKAFSAATLFLTMTLLMLAFSAIAGKSLLNVSRWQIRALSEWPALIEAGLHAGDRRERYTAILLCGAGGGAVILLAELRRCTADDPASLPLMHCLRPEVTPVPIHTHCALLVPSQLRYVLIQFSKKS